MDNNLKAFISKEIKTIKINSHFTHGGAVNFEFYPLTNKSIWLEQSSESTYGKQKETRYVSEFYSESDIKLFQLTIGNMHELAQQLGVTKSKEVDGILESYLKENNEAVGFIHSKNKVFLMNPNNIIKPKNYDVFKRQDIENIFNIVSDNERCCTKELPMGTKVNNRGQHYRLKAPISVMNLNDFLLKEIYLSRKYLTFDDALYHLAIRKGCLTAVVKENLIAIEWFLTTGFISEIP